MTEKSKTLGLTLLLAMILLSATADRFFNLPVGGIHLRFGQAVLILPSLYLGYRAGLSLLSRRVLAILVGCSLTLACLALIKSHPTHSLVKEAWLLINLNIAWSLAATPGLRARAKQALLIAIGVSSALIIWDCYSLYAAGSSGTLGLAQMSYQTSIGRAFLRPHAFYYEPSFAGSALSLAAMLLWMGASSFRTHLAIGGLWSAVLLTTSRVGILSATIFGALALAIERRPRRFAEVAVGMILVLSPLLLTQGGRDYADFFFETLGPRATAARLQSDKELTSSEGGRLKAILNDLKKWTHSPWIGYGAEPRQDAAPGQGLSISAPARSVITEILVEKGLIGAVCSLVIIWLLLSRTLLYSNPLILALICGHFGVNWLFTQTLPRLDYWLFLFLLADWPATEPKSTANLRNHRLSE